MSKKPVDIKDFLAFSLPNEVQLAPGGSWLVWSERYVDVEHGRTHAVLTRGAPGQAPRPLTRGAVVDSAPRVSPDGRAIAFVRTPVGGDPPARTALCLIAAEGGPTRELVRARGDFSAPSWSPDGRELVVAFRPSDEHDQDGPLAVRITRLHYKEDGAGLLPNASFRLYRVRVADPAPALVPIVDQSAPPDADWDYLAPAWSPDGSRIAFLSTRRPDRDRDIEHKDVFVIPAQGGAAVQCTSERALRLAPVWSPAGTWLAVIACAGPPGHSLTEGNLHLHRVAADGSQPEVDLTPELDRCATNLVLDDLWGLEYLGAPPVVATSGRAIYIPISDEGSNWLGVLPVTADGQPDGPLTPVFREACVVCFSAAGGYLAAITSAPTAPGRIERIDPATGERELIAWPMQGYCEATELIAPIELRVPTPDASQVHGWLLLPPGAGPFPLLLSIHGGPAVQYGRVFVHELATYAARGYAVLYANPRGSQGYGTDHARAIRGDWGTLPFVDLMAAVDHVLAHYPIDPERLGVLGGSYGGYMTNWIIAHSKRFKAACTQRTVSALEGLIWSDYGGVTDHEFGAWPWDDPERFQRQSPITYVRNIDTPLLITQGLDDLRTCRDQGERLYVALKALGKDVELVLFPGANHGLSRSGKPRQRLERLRILHEWFERHLMGPAR